MRVAPGGEHNILENYQDQGHSAGYLGFTTVQICGVVGGGKERRLLWLFFLHNKTSNIYMKI